MPNSIDHSEQESSQQGTKLPNPLNISERALSDLLSSGLTKEYVTEMGVRSSNQNIDEYPDEYDLLYHDIEGRLTKFFRTKLFRPINDPSIAGGQKYFQESGTPNQIYFPVFFSKNIKHNNEIILTEGEKKAALLDSLGFAAVAIAGIDSWRNHNVPLPKRIFRAWLDNTIIINKKLATPKELKQLRKALDDDSNIALGMTELIALCQTKNKSIRILFDLDTYTVPHTNEDMSQDNEEGSTQLPFEILGTKPEVESSAFELAMYLINEQVSVSWLELPVKEIQSRFFTKARLPRKIGIDDLAYHIIKVLAKPVSVFCDFLRSLLPIKPSKFRLPTHENLRKWLNVSLDKKSSKGHNHSLSLALLAELDKLGKRYIDKNENCYLVTHPQKSVYNTIIKGEEIYKFNRAETMNGSFRGTMSDYLSKRYGVSPTDPKSNEVIKRFATSYPLWGAIDSIDPYRISHVHFDRVSLKGVFYLQVSDSHFAKVTSEEITFHHNGYDEILFSGDYLFLDSDIPTIKNYLATDFTNDWLQVLQSTRVQALPKMTLEQTHLYLSCLYFLSPFWLNFRGLRLPIEMYTGEPNAGKSFLLQLRRGIITGFPSLDHLSDDIRDMITSWSKSPKMWSGDNVADMPRATISKYSNELARLITDPVPHYSMRKLYTNSEEIKVPLDNTFTFTAVNNPFTKEDILQRMVVVKMLAIPSGQRNDNWRDKELVDGNREKWLARILQAGQSFLQITQKHWNSDYKSSHRLPHFEQSILCMAQAINPGSPLITPLMATIGHSAQATVTENSFMLEALADFVVYLKKQNPNTTKPIRFTASTASDFFQISEGYSKNYGLTNPRVLGKFFSSHIYDLEQSLGIVEDGTLDRAKRYALEPEKVEV